MKSRLSVVILVLVLLAACAKGDSNTASVDSFLARDLTLAAADAPASSTPNAAIGDTAISSSPSAPRPARKPNATVNSPGASAAAVPTPIPAPATVAAPSTAGPMRALGAGTLLSGKTSAEICSLANRPGDRIVAELAEAVNGPDGVTLPVGTPILVEMAQPTADGTFVFRVRNVQMNGELVPVQGTVRMGDDANISERRVSKGGDKGKVITGAIIGAIAGRVLGGGTRGTVIGAAGGAAAGTIAAARNAQTERCLPAGASLLVTLSAPLIFP